MGGGLIGTAIERPTAVAVGVILVLLFGALSVADLPIQLTPDVTVPVVSVSTAWPGATPTEVESDVLDEQEKALKSLPGLVRMTSEATRSRGNITLELEVGASLEEALIRVNNLLSQVPDYPPNVRQPVISTADAGGSPLAVLVIRSKPRGRSVAEYRTWVEEVVLPRYERIPGVASIRHIGGRDHEVHIDFDPRRLAARGQTVGQVARAVQAELRDISGGDLSMGKRRYLVRTQVAPARPEALSKVVLAKGPDGTPIHLGDVAQVGEGLRKADAVGMVDGSPSMALLLQQESGTNVLEVTREIYAVTDELQAELLDPLGLVIEVVGDQVGYINGALDLVEQNILIGGALAMLVLLLFLRSFGAAAVVAISIPVSIVATLLGLSLLGRSINIVSLAGMAFAVGMVVDNAIVVLENIDTWRLRERSVKRAALEGAREVWGAILASTLTTAAVFLPIITWEDEVGELLRDVAMAVSLAVFASLVVSVLVIPSFSARLLRSRKGSAGESTTAAWTGVRGAIARSVHAVTRSKPLSLLVAAVGLGSTIFAAVTMMPPVEYLPTGNRNVVFGIINPPPGYSVDEMETIARRFQDEMLPHTGVEKDGFPALDRSFFVGSPDSAFMGAVSADPKRVSEVATLVRKAQKTIPGVFAFASQASLFGRRLGSGRSIELDLAGADLGALLALGGRLYGALSQAIPGAQIRPIPGLDPGAPEIRINPDRSELEAHGMGPADLGLIVDAYVDGAIIGKLGREGEPKRDVVVRATGLDTDTPEALAAAPVALPGGVFVPLGQLGRIDEELGPTIIQHIERQRAITLQVSPPDDMPFEEALRRVKDDVVGGMMSRGEIPPGIDIAYSGSAGKLDDAKQRFAQVLALAVLISFLLLSALFEDFLAPIAILVTVPLAGAGGVLGLRLVDATLGPQPLDMMTALGFVMLIGIVVNNAILVVDGALARIREGLELPLAVAESVHGRVRPIMMTTCTSLVGLLPLVLFPGSGSELYRGVGAVVLGGLALSTVLTIYVVPAVFTLLWRLRRAVRPLSAEPEAEPTPQ
ncbi:MAG: efflux RND transporter permease subunit [Deltaproteobacteria bacterium]|nr:efflux RND transporter permease subunit [Deltaproteobacteria bacterium]